MKNAKWEKLRQTKKKQQSEAVKFRNHLAVNICVFSDKLTVDFAVLVAGDNVVVKKGTIG